MNEKLRPTKKQKELLSFIESFVGEHGYSPSYREIKSGLSYNSVATVALHVNNLIKRGHLRKRDHSARSLEVVDSKDVKSAGSHITAVEEKWLVDKVNAFFTRLESGAKFDQSELDELYVLVGTLKILDLDDAARSFMPRLAELKGKM